MPRSCTGLPALADDSGLCVTALGGAPGVYSARYAGEPKIGCSATIEKLIAELAGKADRRAHYVCVLVLVRHADDPQPIIAEGEWHGEILDQPRGDGGFGYDPYFCLPELGQTVGRTRRRRKEPALASRPGLAELVERLQSASLMPDKRARVIPLSALGNRRRAATQPIRAPPAALALRAYPVVRAQVPLLRLQLA